MVKAYFTEKKNSGGNVTWVGEQTKQQPKRQQMLTSYGTNVLESFLVFCSTTCRGYEVPIVGSLR